MAAAAPRSVLPAPTPWTCATAKEEGDDDLLRLGDGVVVVVASLVALCLDRVAFLLSCPQDATTTTTMAAAERDALDGLQVGKVAELPVDINERLWAMMVHRGQLSPSALEHFVANRGSFRFSDFAPFVIGASGADGMAVVRQFISVDQLIGIVRSTCPELSELDLSGCTDLLDDHLSPLLNSASLRRTLRSVSLAECIKLTDKSVSLLSHCAQLQFLDLSGNFELTDKSLIVILNKISSLHHLALRDCAGISANVTRQLAKNDASVHTLDLSGVKLQSIFTAQKTKEATWRQLRDLRLQRCVLSLPIIKDLSCLTGLLSLDVTRVVGVAPSLVLDTICTSLTRLVSLTLGGMEVTLASLTRLFATNVSIKRLALSCEIKVEPQGHGKNNKKKKGGNAAKDKKQSQFERAKQVKIKKERRHAASPRKKNAAASADLEAEAKREQQDENEDEDKSDRSSQPRHRQHVDGDDDDDDGAAGESQLVLLSLRGSSVAASDQATVFNTLLLGDTPLPRLTSLDLCMEGATGPAQKVWTKFKGLKALSLQESQWTLADRTAAAESAPIALSRLRIERPYISDSNVTPGLMFTQMAATLTELELVDCAPLSNRSTLFPHTYPPSTWSCTISLLPNLRRLRLIDFVFYEEHVMAFFNYLSASKLARTRLHCSDRMPKELLDLSVTKRRQPFVVASITNWVHYRDMSPRPVRRPYSPSFGYALPFHFPPTLVTLVLRGWIYEHAPDETLLHRETVSDVYRGVQDSGGGERRGHAVEVVQGPPVTEPETSGAFVLGTTPLCE